MNSPSDGQSGSRLVGETGAGGVLRNPLLLLGVLCLVQIGASSDGAVLANAVAPLVDTFDTTVAALQVANAVFPLVGGATMLAFGMLGLIIGWKRLLVFGVLLLVVGETVAALSPNATVFIYVARALTGLGASMATPAVLALVIVLFDGRQRASAYGAIGAAVGLSYAVGPIGSGLAIVGLGWRWAFGLLAILFAVAALGTIGMPAARSKPRGFRFDGVGAMLSGVGLVVFMSGLLTFLPWGVVEPVDAPFTVLGLSPSLFVIALGVFILWLFLVWERHVEGSGRAALLPRALIESRAVRGGLAMSVFLFFVVSGAGFVILTFAQIVIGYSPLQAGLVLALFPVTMAVVSVGTPIVIKNVSPRRACRLGCLLVVASEIMSVFGLEHSHMSLLFFLGLFVAGVGCGLVASQASVVVARAIPPRLAEQSGGIQGAARMVGMALGVVLVGLVLLFALAGMGKYGVSVSPTLPPEVKDAVRIVHEVPFLSDTQLREAFADEGLSEAEQDELLGINAKSRLFAIRLSLLAVGALELLFPPAGLPWRSEEDVPTDAPEPAAG